MKVKIKDGGIYRTVEIDSADYGIYLKNGYVKVVEEEPVVEIKPIEEVPIEVKVVESEPVVEEKQEEVAVVEEPAKVTPKPKKKKNV